MEKYFGKITLFGVVIITCFIIDASAQNSEVPEFIRKELDNYVEEALETWNIPGVSVAVVKDGEVVVAKGYGVRHFQKEQPVDENTLFMIASNTKAFVGTSLAMLEYEGKCKLSDKVVNWVPEFRMNDPWETKEVNINDVLSHRLGLRTFQGDFMYFYSNLTKPEVYQKFPLIVPENGFREQYGYCNAGYFWAGEVIGSIARAPWSTYVEEKILEPLNMENTMVLSEELGKVENLAAAHTLQDGKLTSFPHTNIDVIGPAASMSSSAKDLSHWLIAQLDSGRYNGREVIPFDVIRNTRNPRISQGRSGHIFNTSHYSLYGLGWGMKDYEGVEVISHSGGILGFATGVNLVPEINLGVVVLTNSDENWFYEALKWEIIDAYLGLPFRDYSNVYHKIYSQRQKSKHNNIEAYRDTVEMNFFPSLPYEKFTGTYQNEMYGTVKILQESDKLKIEFEHHPDLEATLEHLSNDRFLCSYYPSRMGTEVFPFIVEKGKVKSFSLKVADRLEYTRYTFMKAD